MIQDEFKEIFARFGLSVKQVQDRLAEIGMGDYSKNLIHPKERSWAHYSYFAMASLVLKNVKFILEIGTGCGQSTNVLIKLFPNAIVYTVDVGPNDPNWIQTWRGSYPEKANVYYKNLTHKNIVVLESNSFFLPALDLPEQFSLIFVDGDHTYPAVASDVSFAYSHMESGGFLFMHDYDAEKKRNDVHRVIDWLAEIIEEKIFFCPEFTHEKKGRNLKVAYLIKEER